MSQYADYLSQIDSLPFLVETEARPIDDRMRLLISTPRIYGIRQVVLTGSGDSYFAAAAVAPAIRTWTGLPVTALPAMEAARYLDMGGPAADRMRGMLVVAVSNSGEAARVVEAVARLRRQGALTLAVTARAESRLARAAEFQLDIAVPAAAPAPGTRSYVACLLALYAVGIRLAEVRLSLTMDEANALRAQLAGLGTAMQAAAAATPGPVATCVEAWSDLPMVDLLSSGPGLASAGYGAAKLIEAAGLHAVAQDAEEFHHLNYFVDQPETVPAVALVSKASRAFGRMREMVETLAALGRPTLLLTDASDLEVTGQRVLLPEVGELFLPLVQTIPLSHLAARWAESRAVPHYRGHAGPWSGSAGAGLVRNSPIEL
jgi:glucosamine--fructose-6-phosphate aminotransferase (isomerizing)